MSRCTQSPWVWRAQALDALVVVRARERLVVPDDVLGRDAELRLQPARQPQRRAHLLRVAQHLRVARADVLDPDRRVVEPDGVAAHVAQRHELVDLAAAVDDEVRADAGQLVQLGVRHVGRERVLRRAERVRHGDVLDDHLRGLQQRRVRARSAAAHTRASRPCAWRRTGSGCGRSAGASAAIIGRRASCRRPACASRGTGTGSASPCADPGRGRRPARRARRAAPARGCARTGRR